MKREEKNPLEILPDLKDPSEEERVSLLNNGYYFEEKEIDNIYNDYVQISKADNHIYISSNMIVSYIDTEYKKIRGNKERYGRMELKKQIDNDVSINIEDNISEYRYISNHLDYISKLDNRYIPLKKDFDYLINRTHENKEDILNILEKVNNIEITDQYKYGYMHRIIDNMLITYPEIIDKEDIYTLNNENFFIEYDFPIVEQLSGSIRIPVLMFHQIATPSEKDSEFKRGLYINPSIFEKEIAYLTKKNYRSITTEEFHNILQSGQNPSQKTVLLTFDDAVLNHYTTAYPILKKYGHTGVFFVPSHRSSITAEQLKEMSDNGMDIQSHSATHPDLSKITDQGTLQTEITGSKHALENITGKSVNSFAYPGCVGNTQTFNTVASSGYLTGFSCGKTIDHFYNKRLALSRRHVGDDFEYFKKILSGIF